MKQIHFSIIFFLSIILLVACNNQGKQEKEADNQLQKIQQLIQHNELNAAKIVNGNFSCI